MSDERRFDISLRLRDGYAFDVDLDQPGTPTLLVDELPPLGEGRGPAPTRLLATAVAQCLASSLLFCLRKARVPVEGLTASAETTVARNDEGRLRVAQIRVVLTPVVAAGDLPRIGRCLDVFEDYCTVTGSVRAGIDVRTHVYPVPVQAAAEAEELVGAP